MTRASAPKRAIFSLRSTAGSPKAWIRLSCKTPRSYSISLAAVSRFWLGKRRRPAIFSLRSTAGLPIFRAAQHSITYQIAEWFPALTVESCKLHLSDRKVVIGRGADPRTGKPHWQFEVLDIRRLVKDVLS